MNTSRRLILVASLLCLDAGAVVAQSMPKMPPRGMAGIGEIHGRLVETGSGRVVSGGSVTVRRMADTTFAGGALPHPDGSFVVDGLTPGRYSVRIRALGFAPFVRTDVAISRATPIVDLGTLSLAGVVAKLEGQTVTAEREDVALAPDRNSYSAKNMTVASGGTAVDILRNVPSVEVDGSDNVTLRGNANVVIQINGRSSPLKGDQLGQFLAQLPASTISRVEVATNPSAKNDPEGTAGIINIVLNQDVDVGVSGGVSATTGTTGQANGSANIGRQSGPLTLFLSGSFHRGNRTVSGFSDRTNLLIPVPAFVESHNDGTMQPRFQHMAFRSEYRLNEHDALSADGMLSGGRAARGNSAYYTDLDASRLAIGAFNQFSNARSQNLSEDFNIAFRRVAGSSTPVLSSELRYSTNRWENENDLSALVLQSDPSLTGMPTRTERDATLARMPSWNLQTDFTHLFGGATKLETGFKESLRRNANDFTAAYLDTTTGVFTPDARRASTFDYHETIGAVYAVLSKQTGPLQTQGGLRLEEASTRFTLPTVNQDYTTRYASAFPSAIVSYNLTDMRQAKVSYSRRVSRPNPFQLSPIPFREDARHEFHGNPSLQAEYTDALELGLQETRGWGSVQLNPYLRKTAHAVRHIQSVDTTGVTVGTFENVASVQTAGADLNVTYHRGGVTLFSGGSAWRYTSDAANLPGNLSTKATIWSVRSNVTWKLSSETDAQFFANYRGPAATEGGSQTAFVMMNFGIRQKLWADQGSLSLRVSDPFSMTAFGMRTADGRYIESSQRRFGMRGVFLTVSRNFGQQLKLRPKGGEQEVEQQPTALQGPP